MRGKSWILSFIIGVLSAVLILGLSASTQSPTLVTQALYISALNSIAEYVTITNPTPVDIDLSCWLLISEVPTAEIYVFPPGTVITRLTDIRVHSGNSASFTPPSHADFIWTTRDIWNDEGDIALLIPPGSEVARFEYGNLRPRRC